MKYFRAAHTLIKKTINTCLLPQNRYLSSMHRISHFQLFNQPKKYMKYNVSVKLVVFKEIEFVIALKKDLRSFENCLLLQLSLSVWEGGQININIWVRISKKGMLKYIELVNRHFLIIVRFNIVRLKQNLKGSLIDTTGPLATTLT